MSTVAVLPMDIIQDILSFLGKEFYQDKKNTTQIRFIPGIFDNVLGYLFDEVSHDPGEDFTVEEEPRRVRLSVTEIRRPNCTCLVTRTFYNDIEYGCKLSYLFYQLDYERNIIVL